MPKLHPLAFATLTLPLLLAACGSASTPVATAGDLVDLTLNSGLTSVTSQGLKAQGLPTNGTVSAVTFIKVNVKDAHGNLVTFDGSNVYKPGGTQTFITLSNTNPTAKLLLPRGTYSFENIGKASNGGQFLAYGQDNSVDLSPKNPSVNLTLHTLINAANSTLIPKLPTTYVNTTDKLDLRLAVKTPSATLDVPLSDYTVTYGSADATVLTSSKLGANVQVGGTTTQTSVSVDATVNGYVATGAETAAVQDQKVTYTVPLSVTGLNTDATPPTVTLNRVAAATNAAITISGTANDNKAISQVRVFDGSVLIGSTNADDVTAGAKLITFTGTTWSFNWTSGSVIPEITVVASDAAGNESRAGSVDASGQVVSWGKNDRGQTDAPALPVGVTYTAVDGGYSHSLALRSDGQAVAWGYNGDGQTNVPALPAGVIYTAVDGGGLDSLALRSDGQVVAFGNNDDGETNVPALPAGVTYTAVAAGFAHNLALRSDGQIVAWGQNYNNYGAITVPALPAGMTYTAVAASVGDAHSLALRSDGQVVAWGNNNAGQSTVPALPAGMTYTAVSAGSFHSLALRSDGQVVAWGYNGSGETNVPALPAGMTYTAVAGGDHHSVALRSDGQVVAWGNNNEGETNVPALPAGQRYTAVSAGGFHTLAIVQTLPVSDH